MTEKDVPGKLILNKMPLNSPIVKDTNYKKMLIL